MTLLIINLSGAVGDYSHQANEIFRLSGERTVTLTHHHYPARAMRAGYSDRLWCPYIYIYVCGRKKYLNHTLEIDSPFKHLQ